MPQGYKAPGKAPLLKKALYSLKQAGRQWYQKLWEVLQTFRLKQTASDPHMFIVHKVVDFIHQTLILSVYMDNLLPISNKVLTNDFKQWIHQYFTVTTPSDAEYFLGIWLQRDRLMDHPWLIMDQHQFIKLILNQFPTGSGKATTPLSVSFHPLPNEEPKEDNDPEFVWTYQGKLGSLMYLTLGTRPDIAYTVGF